MIISTHISFAIGKQSRTCGNVSGFEIVIPAEWTSVIMMFVTQLSS